MLSKAELELLAEKYEAKAARSFELASAMRMVAQASDDYNKLTYMKFEVSMLAKRAKDALGEPEEKRCEAMEQALRNLVSFAVMEGLTTDDELR